MPAPSIPPPIAQLGGQPFSFYPAILNIPHNEWIYEGATWSEVNVRNKATSESIAIPRHYVGEIASADAPVVIVGLLKELEFSSGAVLPAKRRVIEMPLAVNESTVRVTHRGGVLAPVVGIRLEDTPRSRMSRVLPAGVALGVVGCVLAISLYRGGVTATRAFYTPVMRRDLGLSAGDDYQAVVRALGEPAREKWQPLSSSAGFRVLAYPSHRLYVVLYGASPEDATYLGALDRNWRAIQAVRLADGASGYDLLGSVRRF